MATANLGEDCAKSIKDLDLRHYVLPALRHGKQPSWPCNLLHVSRQADGVALAVRTRIFIELMMYLRRYCSTKMTQKWNEK